MVYLHDQSLATIVVEALQRLLDIVAAWSPWTTIEFKALKCWYFYETYQGGRAIHPDVNLTLNGVQIRKADPNVTVWHLGIPVQLNQLCGSGSRTSRLNEENRFLPHIIREVQDRANQIVHTMKLNPVNAIELLDSMAKSKAQKGVQSHGSATKFPSQV